MHRINIYRSPIKSVVHDYKWDTGKFNNSQKSISLDSISLESRLSRLYTLGIISLEFRQKWEMGLTQLS